ncbi:helix-turn-helix domain-containing protein [Pseudomonas sp. NIBR-H-19]|jgi:phage repressor protein C with HTH and peptisase S24 domain|uniref:LexA family transcriptional regulator n=1 Tax=Pseudomonas TaxID=286 RepID=UPI0004D0D14B|nr:MULTISPECIES: S24 family peptidase [Pseudomonas]AIG00900.1 transcriptional regulator [Pseudomonas fluorescens]UHC82345.1 helix-turn-helix domain-containing protein [Pseudomonas sp. NIBR-H-19]
MKKWYELAKARMKELEITQDQVAEQMGVTQGAVAHWLGGRREPSLEKISALLEYLGLASVFRENGAPSPAQRPVEANAEYLGDMAVWSDGDPLEEDECAVPYYAEVEFAGGDGMTVVMEVADRTLRFSSATLRAAGVECENAAVARVRGKSMEKLILDGAAIGFDRADTSVIDGEIYAFNHEGMLRVKYLYRLPGGAIRIRSENADEFPDEIMTSEQYREEIKMLGRVFWWSTVRRSPKKK